MKRLAFTFTVIAIFFTVTRVACAATTVSSNITTNTTWNTAGSPYVITKNISVSDGVILTLEPGTIVKFKSGKILTVYGGLISNGALGQEIFFTGYKDDAHGGDTDGAGASVGTPGYWGGVVTTGAEDLQFSYTQFLYGGGVTYVLGINDPVDVFDHVVLDKNNSVMYVSNTSITLTNSTFSNNAAAQTALLSFASPLISISNVSFTNNGSAINIPAGTTLTCDMCTFTNNLRAVNLSSGTGIITNSSFNNNQHAVYSAALFDAGTVSVHNSYFIDNLYGVKYEYAEGSFELDHNYWGTNLGPYSLEFNPTGIGNTISATGIVPESFTPWYCDESFASLCPVTNGVSNLHQYKYDGITPLTDGAENISGAVVFGATITSLTPTAKLEVEVKPVGTVFDGIGTVTSSMIASGSTAVTNLNTGPDGVYNYFDELIDGEYHWRARTVDETGAASSWVEYESGSDVDFSVHNVPLYMQNEQGGVAPVTEADRWANVDYNYGKSYKGCGVTIAACGCLITSHVMVLRHLGVSEGVDGSDITPRTINAWLQDNGGYDSGNNLIVSAIKRYTGGDAYVQGVYTRGGQKDIDAEVDTYLAQNIPVISKEQYTVSGKLKTHFIVLQNKLTGTYEVNDPAYKGILKLNDTYTTASGRYIDYQNTFAAIWPIVRAGSPLATNTNAAYLSVASPAEFYVTDVLGRKTGYNPISDEVYDEIPEASYFYNGFTSPEGDDAIHETKTIYIPNYDPDQYTMTLIGTGTGKYTLYEDVVDESGNSVDSENFERSIVDAQTVEYTFDPSLSFENANVFDASEETKLLVSIDKETLLPLVSASGNSVVVTEPEPLHFHIVDNDTERDLYFTQIAYQPEEGYAEYSVDTYFVEGEEVAGVDGLTVRIKKQNENEYTQEIVDTDHVSAGYYYLDTDSTRLYYDNGVFDGVLSGYRMPLLEVTDTTIHASYL